MMNRPEPEYLATLTERCQQYIAELEAKVERLQPLLAELREQRGRLEQIEEDFQPGLPERRLADDLLDAIETYEAAEATTENMATSPTRPSEENPS